MRNRHVSLIAVILAASILGLPSADASTKTAGPFVYVRQTASGQGPSLIARSADCPDGSRATGAGGSIAASPGYGWLTRAEMEDSITGGDGKPDDFTVAQGWNADNVSIKLTSVAICMKGSAAPSLTYARYSAPLDDTADHSATTVCVNAWEGIGGGGGANGNGNISLTTTSPSVFNDHHGWSAATHQTASQPGNTLTQDLVCLTTGLKNVKLIDSGVKAVSSRHTRTIAVHCAKGSHVSAGGVKGTGDLQILKSIPFDDGDADHAPDNGWIGKVYAPSTDLTVSVSAYCVR